MTIKFPTAYVVVSVFILSYRCTFTPCETYKNTRTVSINCRKKLR